MIETINGKAYVKVGDKVYEVGGGSNIITADSVEQLPDPASVPEGTIALVPSEDDGGDTAELEERIDNLEEDVTTLGNQVNDNDVAIRRLLSDLRNEIEKPFIIDLNSLGLTIDTAFSDTPIPLGEEQLDAFIEAAEYQRPLVFLSEEVEGVVTYSVRVKAEFFSLGIASAPQTAVWRVVNGRSTLPSEITVDFISGTITAEQL